MPANNGYALVVNPTAGGGTAASRAVPVAKLLREAGAAVTVEYSRSLTHARDLASSAAEQGITVVAVGGDGLVGGLADPVAAVGGVLGVVPSGRGNDFARQLSLPSAPEEVATLLLTGAPRPIDVIELNGRTAVGSLYVGIDSVSNRIANSSRFVPAAVVYHWAALRALITWRPARYHVEVDGQAHDFHGYSVVAANSGFYGRGMHIAPHARVDDGLLDVVLVGDSPRLAFARAMPAVYAGTHVGRPEVTVLRGREVRIEVEPALPVFADGEPAATAPVTARVRPAALRLITAEPEGAGPAA